MTRQKNILFTMLTAIILVTALSFILPKNNEKYLGDMFWTRKTFAPQNYNVILMGDSRMYRGVSPALIKKNVSGLKILNFAYSNGGLNPTMFAKAEEKLTTRAELRIIVLGLTANTLTDYTKNNKQYLQELNRPREEILERLYLNPVSYWFSATSPEKLKAHFQNRNAEKESWYISRYKMNGYVESEKFPADTTEAIVSYTKDFSKFQVEEKHIKTLFQQVEEWSKQGIMVMAFRPPVSQPMLKLENMMGLYDEKKIEKGIIQAGGHWITLNPKQYKTYDGSHVTLESAQKLSFKIAEEIKLRLKQ